MSYILDALRRADAERERGAVPGLHSQPVAAPDAATAPARSRWPLWLAVALGGLLVGLAAWIVSTRSTAPPAPVASVAVPPAATAVVTAAAPEAASLPAPAAAPPASSVAAQQPVAASAAAMPLPSPRPVVDEPPIVLVKPDLPASAARTTVATSPAERIVPWAQLPDDLRRQLPPLVVGGTVWSETPASRMLVIGGQLLHEGDAVAPGLTLEQIRPKSALLRFQGMRFELPF